MFLGSGVNLCDKVIPLERWIIDIGGPMIDVYNCSIERNV